MSNILKVTVPTTSFDSNVGMKSSQQSPNINSTQVQGQVVPDKIVRTDARSDAASDQADAALKFKYETNFDNFIQQIVKSSVMTKEYSSIFMERLGTLAQSGIDEGFSAEISKFLSMIQMDGKDLLSFLKMQGSSAVKFQGIFFELLREAMRTSPSIDVRANVLDFLKKYTDMAEGDHILNNIQNILKDIKSRMFQSGREQIENCEQQMNFKSPNGEVKQNSDVIKRQILPFLNEYIKATHDRGGLRESSAMLATLTARYENGSLERLQNALMKLMSSPVIADNMKDVDMAMLARILANTDYEKARRKNECMDKLAELVRRGVAGEAGVENKAVFKGVLQSLLLNESVYMPILHMTLPLNINGKMMFSELWIDPDAEGDGSPESKKERFVRGLIKFDIEDRGFFDLFFLYSTEAGGSVRMQLNYPKSMEKDENTILHGLRAILAKNNLKDEEIVLAAGGESIPISEAFPKIYERKNSVNVSV